MGTVDLLAYCEEKNALHMLEMHFSIQMVDGNVSICFWHPPVYLERILQMLIALNFVIFQLSVKQNLALWGCLELCNSELYH